MNVTIIIPTINEETLERVIISANREIPSAEIIIVGFGSAGSIAKKNNVSFIDTSIKTPKPIGINKAVRLAKNDWIIILDADAIPLPGWGAGMLKNFQQGKQVFGGSLNMEIGNIWMKIYNLSNFHEFLPENKPEERKHLPAFSLGFTKSVYKEGGDWDETLVRSQDYEWTLRLHSTGVKIWFDPIPCIQHLPISENNFKRLWKAWERNGQYNWLIRKRYKDMLETPTILNNPYLVIWLAPFLAIIPTMRIIRTSPKNFVKYLYLIPFVYLMKIAWCWGVYKYSRQN